MIMEYFVDKIYIHDEKLVVTLWYSEDKTEIRGMLKEWTASPLLRKPSASMLPPLAPAKLSAVDQQNTRYKA